MNNFDISSLMKQAQKMQADMKRVEDDLKERIVEGTAGGDTVTVLVSGGLEVKSVKLDESIVDPEDIETLEDLVLVATNNALKEAVAMKDSEMNNLTGGMGLPPGLM